MKRAVFYISDQTGITAETLGHSLITQFGEIDFTTQSLPFVNTPEMAHEVVRTINEATAHFGCKPLIFTTFVDRNLRDIIASSEGMLFDMFSIFIGPLEKELGCRSDHTAGRSHGMRDKESYKTRIDALNFTLNADDGTNIHQYEKADIIIVGVSRSGKTPTCLYMALKYGLHAANYPFTSDDGDGHSIIKLPECLQAHRAKLFGLTIEPQRLHHIREERRPNSEYASLLNCQREVRAVENLYHKVGIPFLNSTTHSIEEIAARVLHETGIQRKLK